MTTELVTIKNSLNNSDQTSTWEKKPQNGLQFTISDSNGFSDQVFLAKGDQCEFDLVLPGKAVITPYCANFDTGNKCLNDTLQVTVTCPNGMQKVINTVVNDPIGFNGFAFPFQATTTRFDSNTAELVLDVPGTYCVTKVVVKDDQDDGDDFNDVFPGFNTDTGAFTGINGVNNGVVSPFVSPFVTPFGALNFPFAGYPFSGVPPFYGGIPNYYGPNAPPIPYPIRDSLAYGPPGGPGGPYYGGGFGGGGFGGGGFYGGGRVGGGRNPRVGNAPGNQGNLRGIGYEGCQNCN